MKPLAEMEVLSMLRRLTRKLAKQFGFRVPVVCLLNEKSVGWGACEEDVVSIRIREKGRYLSIEEILDTLSHELAHLEDKHPGNHHDVEWACRYDKYRASLGPL